MNRLGLLTAVAVIGGLFTSGAKATLIFSDDASSYTDNAALQNSWGANVTLGGALSFGQLQTSNASISLSNANGGYYPNPTVASHSLGAGAGTFDSNNASADPFYNVPIWSSFLIKPTSPVNDADSYGDTGTILGSYYSNSNGDSHRIANTPAYSPSYTGPNHFVGDNNANGSPTYKVSEGTTYLAIGYLETNGHNYNYGANILAKAWIFDEATYAAWAVAGRNEADLGAYALSEADYSWDTTFGFKTLDSTSLINIQALNGSADFGNFLTGTTLSDVTPVAPEPGTAGLLLIGTAGFGFRRRRRARPNTY